MTSHEEVDFAGKLRERIEAWLQEENWRVGHQSAPDARWVLIINDPKSRPVAIVQPTEHKDQIIITNALLFSEDMQRQLAGIDGHKRRSLIYDLRQAIIQLEVQYAGIGEPLKTIMFSIPIYVEGLSKDVFLRRVTRVRDAAILAVTIVARALDQPPPPEEPHRAIGFDLTKER